MAQTKKIIYIASSGGHLTQLLQLSPLFSRFKSYLVTEKDVSTSDLSVRFGGELQVLFLPETRKTTFIRYLISNLLVFLKSIKLYILINPDIIISTGAGISVYMSYIAKLFGKKVVFIETFAALKKKSGAGKLIYPIADRFYIQWKSLSEIYPKGKYIGSLY